MPFDPGDPANDEREEDGLAADVHHMVCTGWGAEHAELCELAHAQARHVQHQERELDRLRAQCIWQAGQLRRLVDAVDVLRRVDLASPGRVDDVVVRTLAGVCALADEVVAHAR